MSVFFRQEWLDTRLAINNTGETESVYLHYDLIDKIWVPDTYIVNEKSSGSRHDLTTPNILIKLAPDGMVLISQRHVYTFMFNIIHMKFLFVDALVCSDVR